MKKILAALFLLICNMIYSGDLNENLLERIRKGPPDWAIKQIKEDLSSISPCDITQQSLDAAMAERSFGELLLVRYIIRDGYLHVHSTTPGVSPWGRYQQLTECLNKVVEACREEFKIPDCDFIVSLHDAFSHAEVLNTAAFGFAKNRKDLKVILIPDTDVLTYAESLQDLMNRANENFPWDQKIERAVWRGVTTGALFTIDNYMEYPRFQLVDISLNYPEWVDARFTNACQGAQNFRDRISQYFGHRMGEAEHLKFKYQILVDGNSCAYSRAYWQLFSNSVIVKNNSNNIQWYYGALQPYVHYLPVVSDFSNLIEILEWAKANDRNSYEISQNAKNFAHANLLREDMYYYIYLVLCQYSALQH